MKLREKQCGTYEILAYIGSKEGYSGPTFTVADLEREIGAFQDVYPNSMPVRISPCTYIAGSKYREDGHEISVIMYPNQLRTVQQMNDFMAALCKHLMQTFKQNRITLRRLNVPTDYLGHVQTIMFESEAAEVSKSIAAFNAANGGHVP